LTLLRVHASGSRTLAAAAAAAVAALAVPALAHGARSTTLHVGDTLTFTGRTGSRPGHLRRAVGLVVVQGRWNGGRPYVLTRTRTDAQGRYRFVVRPHRHGLLVLRILPPDRHPQRFVVHVL
jgi:plastocyanin